MTYFPLNDQIPVAKDYQYQFSTDMYVPPAEEELQEMERAVGSRIRALKSGKTPYLTPEKKESLFRIGGIASVAIAAVAATFGLLILFSMPVLFMAVPLIPAVGLAALGFHHYRNRDDYHSPEGRQRLMEKIDALSLQGLIKQFPLYEKIIAYQLLDLSSPSEETSPRERLAYYAYFKRLVKECDQLENWHKKQIRKIDRIFNKETAHMQECWRDLKLPEWQLFHEKGIAEWKMWHQTEKEKIEAAYQATLNFLENRHIQMKQYRNPD